ncbi:MAG: PAS domain S-box protein [Anaerolineales bacterium]|nr:PAS domain S-box protein [Anaerolineales bacterium]
MLRKAVDASGEVIFLTDGKGIITYVNPEFTKVYGYHAEEVIGKVTPRILKSGVMKARDYESFWEKLLNKQVVKSELINKRKDGELIFIESSANPVVDQDGNIVGFLAIQRDITERKRAKETLEAAHAFQQSIIDGIPDLIMVINTDFRVMLMNRAAREFSSGKESTPLPIFCYQISHQLEEPCTGNDHPCPLEQVRESNHPITVVHEHFQSNGERRLIEVIAAPFYDANGRFQGIIESNHDITERERVKAALEQYTERLRALAAQLAEAEDAERQRLASELHDQVGQNLTALGINLNIIQAQMPEDTSVQVRFRLEDSHSLVEQTAEQIRDVMANLRPPVLDDYGLVAALRWYGEQFSRRTNIATTVKGEELVPRIAARVENALFRIAQEALTNVAKHAQATQIVIKVDLEEGSLRLIIDDDGIGFTPELAEEHTGDQGWGILTMTERAEAIGGNFRIESSPNQGTRVILEIPR